MGGAWAPRTRRGRGPGDTPPHPRGARIPRGRGPGGPPPRGCPGLGEGASDSTSWTPCSWGGKRMTPPPSRCLCSPSAATQCCTNPRAPAAPLYTPPPKGTPRGRSLKPCLSFYFFFFFAFGREKNRVFDSALFMFLLGNKRWLCVCVFSCVGFLKKWEEEKKKRTPFPFLALAPSLPSFRHPSSRPFCSVVLFCFATSPHSCL